MVKGKQVSQDKSLKSYSTKIKEETKEFLLEIAKVQKLGGQRELIDRMLIAYEEKYPDDIASVKEIIKLRNHR